MGSEAPSRARPQGHVPVRRRLPAAERRALILDSALRTFATYGYDGAAMDEIASAAGISKAVVYDHVESKRDLYTQLLDAIRADVERVVEEALRAPGENREARVRAAVDAIYRYVEERPDAARLLLLELQGVNVSELGQALEERINRHLAHTLGEQPTVFDDHPQRARQLTIFAELLKTALLGAIGWWYRNPEAPRADLVDRTVDVVWPAVERTLGVRPSRA